MKTAYAIPLALALAGAALPPRSHADDTGARALVARALAAMGHGHDLHKLASIQSSAVTVSYDIVENDHLGAPYPFQGAARETIVDDLKGNRRLLVDAPVDAAAPAAPRSVRTLLSRDLQRTEYLSGGKPVRSAALPAPPGWETDDPIRATLLAEQAPDLARAPDVTVHEALQHVLTFHHGATPVRLFIDAATGLPSATEAVVSMNRATSSDVAWNAWGDLVDRTEYMIWDLAGGRRYPTQWDSFRNGVHLRTTVRADVRFDAPLAPSLFAMQTNDAPSRTGVDELALGQPVSMAPDPKKPIAEIAPGVVQIPGSWYSTLVRQDDGVVVIDAPISAGYAARVLDEAARRFPGVPVKAVVASTGFYWHVAGIREYAARGIPIYARDRNVPILRALLAAPHTLAPDRLARAPRPATIRAVSARTAIGTGRNALVLWPIDEGEQPMLMTSLPSAHLLHTGEMVQPLGPNGALLYPESLFELKQAVRRAGLDTDGLRMIGMHMSPTPWTALEQTLHDAGG
ncbi:hypothetical protein ASG87_11410 [Frateuria sp. Soil773]|uniref:hypothetical protein n=1 Tax=Frateuria sp. Soil773 TaxID=1736407 RepID=UPI0006F1C634|nr:hypothetical protein [Frateuria sp. Soil773]KRF02084.1 hypothetical protein ASG87_11410 [Frateuria sp. Soil773]